MMMNDVMKLVKQYDCTIFKQELQLFCLMDIGAPKIHAASFLSKLNKLRGVEIFTSV